MINSGKLAGRTVFITGASRGIGKAIALKAARDGANIVIAAKTAEPNPKLPGTIYSAAKEVEEAGGKCLPFVVDVRDENQVRSAVEEAVKKFGGIDILVNNASAISLTGTADTEMKRYDLMHNINTRGTFLVSKECLPYLKKSSNAHILNISPPLNMSKHWFSNHVAYTMAKYGMSMCVLGMHEELKPFNIAVNALWPRTVIDTAAVKMLTGNSAFNYSRKPEIMADAAYAIFTMTPKQTGNFFIDEDVVVQAGVTDLDQYCCNVEYKDKLMQDGFIDDAPVLKKDQPTIRLQSRGFHTSASQYNEKKDEEPGKVAGLFKAIEGNLNEELVKKTQAVYEFHLKGQEAGKWYIDLKNGKGQCGQGEAPSKADATLTMDGKHFFEMFSGKLKPATAYMMGKLKISGNLQMAMKLEKLMKSLKSKL